MQFVFVDKCIFYTHYLECIIYTYYLERGQIVRSVRS